jgi:hypothetical protein
MLYIHMHIVAFGCHIHLCNCSLPTLPGLALRHRVPLGLSLSSAFFKAAAAAAACPPAWLYSSLPSDSTMHPDERDELQLMMRQQLALKPAWMLPHPWQAAGAAAAALTASKHRQAANQQQQQWLEAALLEWECCCEGRSRGRSVLANDATARPDFAASFVEQRWRQQAQLADLQQIDPEVGGGAVGCHAATAAAAVTPAISFSSSSSSSSGS